MGVDSTKDYLLELTTLEWQIIERKDKNAPKSIDEHTATLVNEKLYIFGGNISGFKSNQIFVFDISKKKWSAIETENGPCERSCHSATLSKECIYVFGGKDQDTNKLNDLWEFNIKTSKWTELQSKSDLPLSRSGHSTCLFNNYLVVFGGIHELTQEMNDIQAYDFGQKQWFSIVEEISSPVHTNPYGGIYSPGRKSFTKSVTAMSANKNHGSNRNVQSRIDQRNNDFSINIHKTAINKKRSRASHNQTVLKSHLTLNQIEKLVLQKRKKQERISEETMLTSPTSLSMKNSFLIKTAGKAFDHYAYQNRKKKTSNLSHNVDVNLLQERQVGKIEGYTPKPRDGHTGLLYGERYLVIFGGDRHHMPFNDLFTLDLIKEIGT